MDHNDDLTLSKVNDFALISISAGGVYISTGEALNMIKWLSEFANKADGERK